MSEQLTTKVNGVLAKDLKQNKTNGTLEADDILRLIPELCNHFYSLGWVSGTGGGLSIRKDGKVYCAPSGVQKERIKPEDMFVLNMDGDILERPKNPNLKCSECLSLFMIPFKQRQSGCCIHNHSIYANLITAFYSEENLFNNSLSSKEFRISNQEMIKGIKKGSSGASLQYNETLIVPIIDNVLHERDLAGAMAKAVESYPLTNAVLVRNHGCYVWGRTWEEAKSMAECYDYLFKLKIEAIKCGFKWMLTE